MSTLPLLADFNKPRLVGIARLAAEGDSIREGHNVEYFSLPSKSLLNKCVSGRRMQILLRALHPRIHGNARRHGLRAEDLRQAARGGPAAE
jgi:hypothetical protein